MNILPRLLVVLCACQVLSFSDADAAVRRFAVAVGNNEGTSSLHALFFAEDDATKMKEVLVSSGGYQPDDVILLLGRKRNDLFRAMVGVRGEIALARERGEETLFIFYYSGHANEKRLQLGRTWVTYDELDELLERTGANVRLAFLDACQSGAMTRSKGGTHAPSFVFDITERLGASGQVVITSSTRDEASQESDEIGGSYFTHFLTSALVGASDDDGDELVTLAEVYRYVYHETVFRTSSTRSGTQHPTYEWDLAGKGDVVLADLSASRSTLSFPDGTFGTYAIFNQNQRMFVAEIELDGQGRNLALRPGSYLVQRRFPSHLEVARLDLCDGATVVVRESDFEAVEYEDDLAKGIIDKRIRQAIMPRLSLHLLAGLRRFSDETIDREYLPATPFAGARARFTWRDGRWASVDMGSGMYATTLQIDGLDYNVPVTVSSTTFGLSAGYATPRLQLDLVGGAGIRVAGAYFRRDFNHQDLAGQDVFSISPGLLAWVGWHPGRIETEVELRLQYLPYLLDERETGLAFSEASLSFGYRF